MKLIQTAFNHTITSNYLPIPKSQINNKAFSSIIWYCSLCISAVTPISWVRRDSSRCAGVNHSWAEMETSSQSPSGSCLDIIDLYHELPSNSSFPLTTETKKHSKLAPLACTVHKSLIRSLKWKDGCIFPSTGWSRVEYYSRSGIHCTGWRWRRGTCTSIYYSPVWALKIALAVSFLCLSTEQRKPKIGRSWHAAAAKCHCVFSSDFSLSCRCAERHRWPSSTGPHSFVLTAAVRSKYDTKINHFLKITPCLWCYCELCVCVLLTRKCFWLFQNMLQL